MYITMVLCLPFPSLLYWGDYTSWEPSDPLSLPFSHLTHLYPWFFFLTFSGCFSFPMNLEMLVIKLAKDNNSKKQWYWVLAMFYIFYILPENLINYQTDPIWQILLSSLIYRWGNRHRKSSSLGQLVSKAFWIFFLCFYLEYHLQTWWWPWLNTLEWTFPWLHF